MGTEQEKVKSKRTGYVAIIIVNFLWGLDYIVIDYMMNYVSPQFFTLIRVAICALVMLCVLLISGKGFKIEKKDLVRFLLVGATGNSIYFTIETLGTGLTSASFASLMMALVPVFGIFVDRVVYGNRITVVKIVCALVSMIGVYLIVTGSPLGMNIKGTLVMLSAAIIWACYIAALKPLEDKYDMTTLLTGLFTSGLISQVILTLVLGVGDYEFTTMGIILTIVTPPLFLIAGNFGYVHAIGRLSVSMVAMFENVLPLTSIVVSFIIFGASLSPVQLLGGGIIIVVTTVLALKE